MKFFGCDQREPLVQVKTHLVTEAAQSACACPVRFGYSFIHNMAEQIEILLHDCKVTRICDLELQVLVYVGNLWIGGGNQSWSQKPEIVTLVKWKML